MAHLEERDIVAVDRYLQTCWAKCHIMMLYFGTPGTQHVKSLRLKWVGDCITVENQQALNAKGFEAKTFPTLLRFESSCLQRCWSVQPRTFKACLHRSDVPSCSLYIAGILLEPLFHFYPRNSNVNLEKNGPPWLSLRLDGEV